MIILKPPYGFYGDESGSWVKLSSIEPMGDFDVKEKEDLQKHSLCSC